MNGWLLFGILTGSTLAFLGLVWLTLALWASTGLAHVVRGELELDDESEDD